MGAPFRQRWPCDHNFWVGKSIGRIPRSSQMKPSKYGKKKRNGQTGRNEKHLATHRSSVGPVCFALSSHPAADQSVITRWVACLLQSQLPFQANKKRRVGQQSQTDGRLTTSYPATHRPSAQLMQSRIIPPPTFPPCGLSRSVRWRKLKLGPSTHPSAAKLKKKVEETFVIVLAALCQPDKRLCLTLVAPLVGRK